MNRGNIAAAERADRELRELERVAAIIRSKEGTSSLIGFADRGATIELRGLTSGIIDEEMLAALRAAALAEIERRCDLRRQTLRSLGVEA